MVLEILKSQWKGAKTVQRFDASPASETRVTFFITLHDIHVTGFQHFLKCDTHRLIFGENKG